MKATLNIPDDVARAVQRRAERDGRELAEEMVRLVELGLLAADVPAAEFERLVRSVNPRGAEPSTRPSAAHAAIAPPFSTDPATGLPVIDSPPDAPVRAMTLDEVLGLAHDAQAEDDLERAGLPVRH